MEIQYLSHRIKKFLKAANYTELAGLMVALTLLGSAYLLHQPSAEYTATFQTNEKPEITLEVAKTSEERKKGLMGRKKLPEKHGMIFVFPDEQKRDFWMKNTYIHLDIIYLDSNLTVVDIKQAEPQPNATEEELKIYTSSEPAKYVIELNKGFSSRNSISLGTRVTLGPRLRTEISTY